MLSRLQSVINSAARLIAGLRCPDHITDSLQDTSWRRGTVVGGVRRMNEVNARRARLVPGWVTVFGRLYHLGM